MKFDADLFESLTPMCRDKVSSFIEIESTNIEAKTAVMTGDAQSGNIYITEFQTRGRGRGDHQWMCPAGEGLLFSIVLDPDVDIEYWYRMSLAVGLAIVDVTRSLGVDTMMKWPNDIYHEDKKLGGILIETVKDKLVVGVGLNVNVATFPNELSQRATSIRLVLGKKIEREELLSKLIAAIYQNGSLIGVSFSSLLDRVQGCLYMKGNLVSMNTPEGKLIGKLVGLSEDGYLQIEEMSETSTVREVLHASEIRKLEG